MQWKYWGGNSSVSVSGTNLGILCSEDSSKAENVY